MLLSGRAMRILSCAPYAGKHFSYWVTSAKNNDLFEYSNTFNSLLNRRHHCRLCGRVVCEKDSSNMPLDIPNAADGSVRAEIRACSDCKGRILRFDTHFGSF